MKFCKLKIFLGEQKNKKNNNNINIIYNLFYYNITILQ